MVEEGLFEKFPCEAVYGMHNWPGMPVGQFALRAGPGDGVVRRLRDHDRRARRARRDAAHRHRSGRRGAQRWCTALQTIPSRNVNPVDAAVVSVTQFHAGDAWNVIPEAAMLRGTARAFSPAVQDAIEAGIRRIVAGIDARIRDRGDGALRAPLSADDQHAERETAIAGEAIAKVVGEPRTC